MSWGGLKMAKIVSQSSFVTSNRSKSMQSRATDSAHIFHRTSVLRLKRDAVQFCR